MLKTLDAVIETLLGGVLAVLVLVGAGQVLARVVFSVSMAWALEASIVLMVWATLLAGYAGVRRNSHLSADFAGVTLTPATRWKVELVSLALCVVFTVVYGLSSFKVIDAMDGIPFASLPFGQPVLYWALPVSAVLMLLAFAVRIRHHWALRPKAT